MKAAVTRFDPQQARVVQDGNLTVFDMAPKGKETNLVFHWVKVKPNGGTKPELNTVEKTFLFFEGRCTVDFADGIALTVGKGDALWLPEGSTHTIRNSDSELQFIVVKPK